MQAPIHRFEIRTSEEPTDEILGKIRRKLDGIGGGIISGIKADTVSAEFGCHYLYSGNPRLEKLDKNALRKRLQIALPEFTIHATH